MQRLSKWYSTLVPLVVRDKMRWMKNPVEAYIRFWLLRKSKGHILTGPFKNAVYTEAHLAKVIGVYEKEIYPFLNILAKKKFDIIYDIGAAGGYYIAGFSKIFPDTRMIAYEMLEHCWKRLEEVAAQNGVPNKIEIRGEFSCDEWNKQAETVRDFFIMMDVEGAELTLLNPVAYPVLYQGHILVEIHENEAQNCESTIRERFVKTHQILEVESEERKLTDFPEGISMVVLNSFKSTFLEILSDQRLDKQKWLLLIPEGK